MPDGHRIVSDLDGWMRSQEKRVQREERRPQITHASDLMGPGLGPYAVLITDWNGDETYFNGFFYSEPGATGAPDGGNWWMGQTIAQIEGYGVQVAYDFRGTSSPVTEKRRRFSTVAGTRTFSAWA